MTPRFFMATIAAMMLLGGQSYAADLGGNCCADLEERVAELEATTARKGNRKVSLEVSGHINEAVLFTDVDGYDQRARIIPGTQSQSRFRFAGESKISSEWSAGFLMEIGVGNFEAGGAINRDLGVRHSALYVKSKSVGTVWLGHTSMASDGAAEVDLSRSSVASLPLSLAPADGAILGVNGLLPWDGGRANVVKYITPTVAGFSASASLATEDVYDAALRYAGEFGNIRVAGAIAYRHDDGPSLAPVFPKTETIVGSFSIMEIKSGLFVNGSYGQMTIPGIDSRLIGYAARGGIETPIQGHKVTIYGEFARVEWLGEEIDMYGAGVVKNWGALDLYASYKRIDLGDGQHVGMVGAKISF